jgi:hypothetical protein
MIMTIREALEDVEIAFRQFEFAVKLLTFCELKKIDPSDFDTGHLVQLKQGFINFPSGDFSTADDIIKAAGTSVLMAFSVSVLVLDKAFEVAGMEPDPEAIDDIGRLRALIYMLRCAQAHGIADPKWEARGRYARTLAVDLDGVRLSLDLQTLNGQAFDIDQLGGYLGWYRIGNAAIQALSPVSAV